MRSIYGHARFLPSTVALSANEPSIVHDAADAADVHQKSRKVHVSKQKVLAKSMGQFLFRTGTPVLVPLDCSRQNLLCWL